MLSPENYIRQKARNLPIYECRINKDWDETGLAQINVARKHTNGNITMGMYLVDLKLLGVKDAFYRFNISEQEYSEIIEEEERQKDIEKVSYTLIHNIIFAGIEYTDELLGIEPDYDINRKKWEDQFSELYILAINKPKSAGKKIKKLQKKMPENPALAFLELLIMQSLENPAFEEKLMFYHERFPRYPLIKILKAPFDLQHNEDALPIDYFQKGPEEYFNGRESIHHIELFHYLFILTVIASTGGDITLTEIVKMIIDEIEIPEEDNIVLAELISLTKINFIFSLKKED